MKALVKVEKDSGVINGKYNIKIATPNNNRKNITVWKTR